jgi:hypothetical protein
VIDIVTANDGEDFGALDTQAPRAANILSVQFGTLEYAQDLGPDIAFFLNEDFNFENESFQSYLITLLANRGINVVEVLEVLERFTENYTFKIRPEQNDTSLVAR